MALTYPIEQPYRLKYINPIFYIGSIILLILLVPLNVILGGYDTITIWLADPKTESYEPWWAPKSLPEALRIRTKPGECQGARLDKNNPLRTNSPLPLFSYVLSSDFNQSASLNENGVRTETSYMANPLNGCHITNMSMTLEPKMLFIKVDATVFCDPMGDPPHSRQFVTSFTRTPNDRYRPDSIVRYMEYTRPENKYGRISRGGPPQDTYLNVLGVLDTLSRDLVRMIEIRKIVWGYDEQPRSRPDLEFVQWEVVNNSLDPDLTRLSFIPAVGSMGQGEPYLNYMRQATMNVFVIVRDAIHIDLGYSDLNSTNVYANKTLFNQLIKPDPRFIELLSMMNPPDRDQMRPIGSWGWGAVSESDLSLTWTQRFTSTDNASVNNITLPIRPDSDIQPTVFDIAYLCPQYKIKSWGSLLVAVFTGTFTMYLTIYGIFSWLAATLDRKRYGDGILGWSAEERCAKLRVVSNQKLSHDLSQDELDTKTRLLEMT